MQTMKRKSEIKYEKDNREEKAKESDRDSLIKRKREWKEDLSKTKRKEEESKKVWERRRGNKT